VIRRGSKRDIERLGGDRWQDVVDEQGMPRPPYQRFLDRLNEMSPRARKRIDERLESTMREMGVTFDIMRENPWGRRPWYCDPLPQIIENGAWDELERGMVQRLRAFELFLRDIYSNKEILRAGRIPIHAVLGSPFYQRVANGLTSADHAYLHLSGMNVVRDSTGQWQVKHHYFSHASGVSYMMQNRRAMARVLPETFLDYTVESIADVPIDILEILRRFASERDPTVVILSPGAGSPAYSEHSFLARRMGVPLVQGSDLLVLNDRVYLKTVTGLEKVEVIYTRVADAWLDPLVFRRDSRLGVPGLVHCLRKGSVSIVNAIGSQLADDRALLPFAERIVQFYLGEAPLLKTVQTHWLGDLDQREMVMENLEDYEVRPLYGERFVTPPPGTSFPPRKRQQVEKEILANPDQFVAQEARTESITLTYEDGSPHEQLADQIVFALRRGDDRYEVFPGALTRVSTSESLFTASELGGGSKDTWVTAQRPDADLVEIPRTLREARLPSQHVTSRVAEAFYWIGRYLERTSSLAGMINVIETLETEELNATERKLYRPVWNRLLPPLENLPKGARRNISTPAGRYQLTTDPDEPGSVWAMVSKTAYNADMILECISIDAWTVLETLRNRFQRRSSATPASDLDRARITRRLCDTTTSMIAEFFGVAEATIVADGGWQFCRVGQLFERAVVTANAVNSMAAGLENSARGGIAAEHAIEIELSAFLRLLNSRDAYRRVYQMRTEPAAVLECLWKSRVVPRAVSRCLERCAILLGECGIEGLPATQRTLNAIENVRHRIAETEWELFFENSIPRLDMAEQLDTTLADLTRETLEIHQHIADGFLNHQIHMRAPEQSYLEGFHAF